MINPRVDATHSTTEDLTHKTVETPVNEGQAAVGSRAQRCEARATTAT